MKVSVKADVCIGCGLCVNIAPSVFEMHDNKAVVTVRDAEEMVTDVTQESADNCPVNAITIM